MSAPRSFPSAVGRVFIIDPELEPWGRSPGEDRRRRVGEGHARRSVRHRSEGRADPRVCDGPRPTAGSTRCTRPWRRRSHSSSDAAPELCAKQRAALALGRGARGVGGRVRGVATLPALARARAVAVYAAVARRDRSEPLRAIARARGVRGRLSARRSRTARSSRSHAVARRRARAPARSAFRAAAAARRSSRRRRSTSSSSPAVAFDRDGPSARLRPRLLRQRARRRAARLAHRRCAHDFQLVDALPPRRRRRAGRSHRDPRRSASRPAPAPLAPEEVLS